MDYNAWCSQIRNLGVDPLRLDQPSLLRAFNQGLSPAQAIQHAGGRPSPTAVGGSGKVMAHSVVLTATAWGFYAIGGLAFLAGILAFIASSEASKMPVGGSIASSAALAQALLLLFVSLVSASLGSVLLLGARYVTNHAHLFN